MSLSYKTLLITCIPFSLQSMELSTSSTNRDIKIMQKQKHWNKLNILYNKTYDMLGKYEATSPESTSTLLEIINITNDLKNKGVLEQHIGLFAFTQNKEPFFQKNLLLQKGTSLYNGSDYVSVFFAKIKAYNNTLTKNEFISPTLEQTMHHKNNEKIKTACNNAANFRLFIDLNKINAEKKVLTRIPENIACCEFQQLMDDIAKMRRLTPDIINTVAILLYANTTASVTFNEL